MSSASVLFPPGVSHRDGQPAAPAFFADLNLDQVVQRVAAPQKDHLLAPYFQDGPQALETILFRQAVFQDLEVSETWNTIKAFERTMKTVRESLAQSQQRYHDLQKQAWFLKAVTQYCEAVLTLAAGFGRRPVASPGLRAFENVLGEYLVSSSFRALNEDSGRLQTDLEGIRYGFSIERSTVRVRRYAEEIDLSSEVERTFEKFQQGAVKDHLLEFSSSADMNHIEAKILELVARLYPEVFGRLSSFFVANQIFASDLITAFDREVQFYVAFLESLEPVRALGLSVCYPELTRDKGDICQQEAYDLALAYQRIGQPARLVTNDYFLSGFERILVVSGPNQGGKTTFARAFGQSHHLASLGCPVPGIRARLFLHDRIYTHFEAEEDLHNQHGKLYDDILRFHQILNGATPDSLVVMNEIFNGTTLRDAVVLARRALERISDLDALGVCVTFLDEMASLNAKTVSFVSTVAPDNPAERTFKIVRKPADGMAYALSLVEKHRLTRRQLLERLAP